MSKTSKPIWAIDDSRIVNGKPVTRRFTTLAWNLLAGDDNLKAGRWRRIEGPKPVKAVNLGAKKPKVDATRAAIDLAKNEGIDILQVSGSGENGRITKGDVDQYLADMNPFEEEE